MENYEQFLKRTGEFEQPVFTLPNEYFSVNPALRYKVEDSGTITCISLCMISAIRITCPK